MALLFTARVVCVQAVAGHVQVPKVLNAPEDLAAVLAQSVAAQAPNAAGVDQNVAAQAPNAAGVDQNVAAQAPNAAGVDQNVAAQAPNAAGVDQIAAVVRNAGAFPHEAVAPNWKVVAHNF